MLAVTHELNDSSDSGTAGSSDDRADSDANELNDSSDNGTNGSSNDSGTNASSDDRADNVATSSANLNPIYAQLQMEGMKEGTVVGAAGREAEAAGHCLMARLVRSDVRGDR